MHRDPASRELIVVAGSGPTSTGWPRRVRKLRCLVRGRRANVEAPPPSTTGGRATPRAC